MSQFREKLTLFFDNFFGALRDKSGSHSLKKWICVGIFWVYAETSVRFTTKDNLVEVLAVHAGLIVTLLGIHTYQKIKTNKPNNGESAEQTPVQ